MSFQPVAGPRTEHSKRDSPGVHVTASVQITDDTLVADQNFCGLAIKQVMPSAYTPRNQVNLIAAGERYFIWDSGEVDVFIPSGLTPTKGMALWINPADNTLHTATGTGFLKLGKVRYVYPERGLDSGMMTVGFDARKDF